MPERKLTPYKQSLLHEVLLKYLPNESGLLLQQPTSEWLGPLRARVRDAVGQDLAETGFDGNEQPTERGRALEDIIDYLNRIDFETGTN